MLTRAQQRNRRALALKRAFFADKRCAHCGSKERLTLDHIDPTTKDPALKNRGTRQKDNLWKWGRERRNAELAKCRVLCWPCHQARNRRELD